MWGVWRSNLDGMTSESAKTRTIALDRPLDLRLTFNVTGLKGPSMRVADGGLWRATRTPDGPATTRMAIVDGALEVGAWGPGSDWALDRVPQMVGESDDASPLVPHHEAVAVALRKGRGVRLPSVLRLVEVLIVVVVTQKVTGKGAARSYRELVTRYSERAPGPGPVWTPPDPEKLASLPYFDFHPLGIERKRAEIVTRVCRDARRLEAGATMDLESARTMLARVRGIGPWTIGRTMLAVRGDPDAVPVGDYHVPNVVSWALAGEPRGTDERMLELLEPYAGQRGRVVRLLESFGEGAPKYGPPLAPRQIRAQ